MTREEIIQRLKTAPNRAAVARATGLSYGYLNKLVQEDIENPGSAQVDILRNYFLSLDVMQPRHQ